MRAPNLFSLTMDLLLYCLAVGLVALLQALPLKWVARIGRGGGALAYWLDIRHRRVAKRNLELCFGREKSHAEIRALARENFRRIGENFACAVKTASMSLEELKKHMEVTGREKIPGEAAGQVPVSRIFAIGHFGNFEMFARAVQLMPEYRGATTYRALHSERLTRLLLSLRERNDCLFFERRMDGAALRAAITKTHLLLAFLSDQHSGAHGVRIPFFGRECSTTKAPAVFALRYELPLHTAICFRTGLGQWRIEVGDAIPTMENGQPRRAEDIMLDVNRAFEEAILRNPANWFWVHNRWKPPREKKTFGRASQDKAADSLVHGDPV